MTDITVKDFSKTVGLPVNRLMDQLELAGVGDLEKERGITIRVVVIYIIMHFL